MEIEFVAAMSCLAVDIGNKYYQRWRPFVVGSIATGSLIISLADIIANWLSYSGSSLAIQPNLSGFASLYVINPFTMFIVFTAIVLGTVVTAYSWFFLSNEDNSGPFFGLLLLLLTSIIGVVSAGDLLTLFLFWEGMSISAYGMVAFYRDSAVSLEASLKYLFLAGAGTLLALFGISLAYSLVGSIQIASLSTLFASHSEIGVLALLFMILGFGVEAAIFPLHTWLPDVYSAAPAPISAIVSGIVTETGVFTLIKIVQPLLSGVSIAFQTRNLLGYTSIESIQLVLAVLAVLTMFTGNLGGFVQTNVKRILGFSSIAQMGYMIAAISTFTVSGFIAVVFNIWNHGIIKSSFFLLSGTAGKRYEDTELNNLAGFGQRNKVIGWMYASSSLAMVGSPPFGLFWSELLIVESLFSAPSLVFTALGILVVANIFLSIGYYMRIVAKVSLGSSERSIEGQSISFGLVITPILLLALSLLTGLLPYLILSKIVL